MDETSHHDHTPADFYMAALWDAARPAVISVPGYTILGEISRGGMGVVYHAEQLRPKREVALKVLLPHLAEEPEMLARFQLEARAMAALDHAGILPVYEVGEADGVPFFSMKLATGGSLSDRLLMGNFKPRDAASLMIQLTRAVHHAHQHGVLHRDLKPGNFLFLEDGRACVSDFGLAKLTVPDQRPLTRTQSFFGTPHYMPPEVAAGSVGDATVAGDLYSMGAVFYECLTGRRPHPMKENVAALLRSIADDPATPLAETAPGLPRDLVVICMKSLQRNPADRYATLDDFADDLQRWMDGRAIRARPAGPLESAWRWAGRHPLPAGLGAALLAVTVAGAVLLAVSHNQRGAALLDARRQLQRSLIDQARSERLLGKPGHRDRALAGLRQASGLARSPQIRDEAAALLARPDVSPVATVKPADDTARGPFHFTTDDSGTVRLWKKDAPDPLKEWMPPAGGEIIGKLTPDGNRLVLAGTDQGTILSDPSNPQPEVLSPPGTMVRFLTIDPAGRKAALARVDGLTVVDLQESGKSWHFGAAQARCAASWSADGSRLAAAVGDRREAVILAADTGAVCATAAVTGTPQHLAFHPGGSLLAVASDDGVIAICEAATGALWTTLPFAAESLEFSGDGKALHATGSDGKIRSWPVSLPDAFHEWPEPPRAKQDGAALGMALSPNGAHLLTVATGCIGIWSVADERQTGHHLLENQRIDVKASAWWLGNTEILIQIPGGLERMAIDSNGKPGAPLRIPKVPGSSVLDVRPDGGWIVSMEDEDGNTTCELWPGGDSTQARTTVKPPEPEMTTTATRPPDELTASLAAGDAILVRQRDGREMRLVPPLAPGVRALRFSNDGTRLLVLTRLHRVHSWNLTGLAAELDANGL
ncbi:MAG: WD40 repeat domain-containing serine/threonine protein kinase [Verrucomicrobiota bacterium]